jgi:hypothetical protein
MDNSLRNAERGMRNPEGRDRLGFPLGEGEADSTDTGMRLKDENTCNWRSGLYRV